MSKESKSILDSTTLLSIHNGYAEYLLELLYPTTDLYAGYIYLIKGMEDAGLVGAGGLKGGLKKEAHKYAMLVAKPYKRKKGFSL